MANLSACQTAHSRYEQLLDEGINITSAFRLAGFPSVIGTLWNVDDKFSVEIAKNVYRHTVVDPKWFGNGTEHTNVSPLTTLDYGPLKLLTAVILINDSSVVHFKLYLAPLVKILYRLYNLSL